MFNITPDIIRIAAIIVIIGIFAFIYYKTYIKSSDKSDATRGKHSPKRKRRKAIAVELASADEEYASDRNYDQEYGRGDLTEESAQQTSHAPAGLLTTSPPKFDYMKPSVNRITDSVYITDCSMTFKHDLLSNLQITQMIAVGDTLKIHDEDKYKILHIKIDEYADLKQYFESCNNFINDNASGKTLVYCVNGVSRSAAVIAAHLMLTYNFKTKQAVDYILRFRPTVHIEDNFYKQLLKLECEMDKKNN
jgi:protein-tyrosine phosphatase